MDESGEIQNYLQLSNSKSSNEEILMWKKF